MQNYQGPLHRSYLDSLSDMMIFLVTCECSVQLKKISIETALNIVPLDM